MNRPNLPPPIDCSLSKPAPSRLNVVGSNHQQQVKHLPESNSVPVWLRSLLTIQHRALIVCASMLGLSALVYGYTAYTQSLWRSQYEQLQRLQLQESQQAMMNEHLKQQMAQAAQGSKSGLIAPNPDRMVFIPIAPQRPAKSLPTPHSSQPVGVGVGVGAASVRAASLTENRSSQFSRGY